MKLAYITAHTPYGRGETFILEEMLAVVETGTDLLIVPRNPPKEVFHAKAKNLLDRTLWLPLFNWKILASFLVTLFTCLRVWNVIWKIFKESRSFSIILKNLAVLPKATHIARIFKRLKVEHIHAHWGSTTATMAWIVSELTNIPFSVTLHRWDIAENNMLKTKAEKALFFRFISEDGLREALNLLGESYKDKFKIIHIGVRIPKDNKHINKEPSKLFTIACSANLVLKKGHKYLIEACSLLVKRGVSNFQCLIIGDGPLENAIREQIEREGLNDYVKLMGRIPHDDLLKMYEQGEVDAVVLPSVVTEDGEKEGIPVALMEAMAYGIPVISTTTGGIPELLRGGAGLLVPPASSEALAEAILKLMQDEALKESLIYNAKERINQEFNLQLNVEKLVNFMKEG